MRQRHGSDRLHRAVIGLIVIASLVAVFAGVQLLRGDGAESKELSSTSPVPEESGSLDLGPDSSYEEPDADDDGSSAEQTTTSTSGAGLLSLPDVYANPRGPARRLHVVLTLKSDGPIYEAYDFRDGKRGGPSVVDKTLTVTRTLRGPFPVARLAAQVMMRATYVTCRITVDGTVIAEDTAYKPGYVAACVG